MSIKRPFKLLSLVEATTITGPMKPLLMFAKFARDNPDALSGIRHTIVTTVRGGVPNGNGGAKTNAFISAARAAGLEVDVVDERRALDPAVLGQMAEYLRRRSPDIVETHDFKSHFLMWLLRRRRDLPEFRWVAFHHGYTRMSWRVRAYQQLDRLSLPNADRVITVCKPFVVDLVRRGVDGARISVIENAVEGREKIPAAEGLELRRALGLRQDSLVVLSVGRLSKEKGHPELLLAFRQLLRDGQAQPVQLLIVGDGGEANVLREAAADLKGQVIFTGHQPDPWPFFSLADIFVLPSHTEGSPLVLFEAMNAGLPILASAVGGIPEVVQDHHSALLIRPRSAQRIAAGLQRLISDPSRRHALGAQARLAAAHHGPDRYVGHLLEIYRGLLPEAGRPATRRAG